MIPGIPRLRVGLPKNHNRSRLVRLETRSVSEEPR